MLRKFLLLAVLGWLAWSSWSERPIHYSAGVVVQASPKQMNLRKVEQFQHEGFVISRKASFEIRARVLGKERYRFGTEADLSPVDLALGWGPMSNEQVIGQLDISQGNRWYYFKYAQPPPIPQADIIRHSSNMHMIPADRYTAKQLTGLRPGAVVSIRGYLVDVDRPDGWKWRTSMRRDDTGAGACEIVWVEQVFVEETAAIPSPVRG
jgi:hypothetical protein